MLIHSAPPRIAQHRSSQINVERLSHLNVNGAFSIVILWQGRSTAHHASSDNRLLARSVKGVIAAIGRSVYMRQTKLAVRSPGFGRE
jgi:hypothetical protein